MTDFFSPYMGSFAQFDKQTYGNHSIGDTLPNYIKKGNFLVGFKYDPYSKVFCYDLRQPRYLPISIMTPNPPRGMILGKAGDGKTSLNGILMWNAILKGMPVFVIDPKASMGKFKEPQKDPTNVKILQKLGIQPQGLDIYVMCPTILQAEQGSKYVDEYFKLSKADLDAVKDKGLRAEILKCLIDTTTQGDDASFTDIISLWGVTKTWRELINALETKRSTRGRERLINLVNEGLLDADSTETLSFVHKIKEKPVIWQLSISGGGKEIQALVMLGIQLCKQAAEKRLFDDKTFLIIGEEIDVLLQGNEAGSKQLNYTYTKMREGPKIAPFFSIQNPGDAKKGGKSFMQSEIFISSRQNRTIGTWENPGYSLVLQFNGRAAGIVTRLKDRGSLPNKHISEKLLVVADKVMTFIPLITPFNT